MAAGTYFPSILERLCNEEYSTDGKNTNSLMDIPLSDLRNEIISTVLTQEIVDLPTTKKICGIASSIYYS